MKNILIFFIIVVFAFNDSNAQSQEHLQFVDTISDLENLSMTNIQGQTIIYVKGYSIPNDGGGGIFRYAPGFTNTFNGMYIVPSNNTGRWVRIYDKINVKYFGAIGKEFSGGILNNDTNEIQDAIDFANQYDNSQIFIPKGTYVIDQLILKNSIKIKGELNSTIIRPSDSSHPDLIIIDDGPVTGLKLEDLHFDGKDQDKTCFFIEAKGTGNIGGLWSSTFSNMTIRNFGGHGIYLKGDNKQDFPLANSSQDFPNQFLIFKNVLVKRKQRGGFNALKITGQTGQVNFFNCSFDGKNFSQGNPMSWNVHISNLLDDYKGRPAIIKFDTCTIQNAIGGVYIENSENITIDSCWFENLDTAISIKNSYTIDIERSRFANASDYGNVGGAIGSFDDGNNAGFILSVTNNSIVKFSENLIAGNFALKTIQDSSSFLDKKNNYYKSTNSLEN